MELSEERLNSERHSFARTLGPAVSFVAFKAMVPLPSLVKVVYIAVESSVRVATMMHCQMHCQRLGERRARLQCLFQSKRHVRFSSTSLRSSENRG